MTMQHNIDIFRRRLRRNMLQTKLESPADTIDNQRPLRVTVAISAHDNHRWADRSQFIQNHFRANVAQMPDFIRIAGQIDHALRQLVMRVGKDKYFCHIERRWIGRSAGDVKTNAPSAPKIASSKGLLDPPLYDATVHRNF